MLQKLLPEALQPFGKAIWPALTTFAVAGVQYLLTGSIDELELATAGAGVGAAAIAFLSKNKIRISHLQIRELVELVLQLEKAGSVARAATEPEADRSITSAGKPPAG